MPATWRASCATLGIDLYRKTTVGDNAGRIAQAIQQALERCEIIITTGGLGPTVDDPTREAIALALDIPTEFRPELWEQIQSRFKRYRQAADRKQQTPGLYPPGRDTGREPGRHSPGFHRRKRRRSSYARR